MDFGIYKVKTSDFWDSMVQSTYISQGGKKLKKRELSEPLEQTRIERFKAFNE